MYALMFFIEGSAVARTVKDISYGFNQSHWIATMYAHMFYL